MRQQAVGGEGDRRRSLTVCVGAGSEKEGRRIHNAALGFFVSLESDGFQAGSRGW